MSCLPDTTWALLRQDGNGPKAHLSKLVHDNTLFDPSQAQRAWYVFSLGSFELKEPSFGQRRPYVDREALFGFREPFIGLKGSSFDLRGSFLSARGSFFASKGLCMGQKRALSSRQRALSDRQRLSFCQNETSIGLRRSCAGMGGPLSA